MTQESYLLPRFMLATPFDIPGCTARRLLAAVWICISLLVAPCARAADDAVLLEIERKVTHGYATNDGVRIHYAHLGQGSLVE